MTTDDTPCRATTSRKQSPPAPARDLADFHLRWREFRPHALSISENHRLSLGEAACLNWLVALADRVGLSDIEPPAGPPGA